jgi:GntR family transcriptional regulator, transcriptional repressor for pyruvate dehydrogenase complex
MEAGTKLERKAGNNHLLQAESSIAPIDRSGITELVVQRIKELLERGDLKAGSRLPPERELAEMLGISRPSLRTALKALSVMGIIRAKPGAGTFIAEAIPEIFMEPMHFMTLINNTALEEVFEARIIIESALAELAAERAGEKDLQAMTAELGAMREATNNPDAFLKHDMCFHQLIARASGNNVMSGIMDTVAQMLYQMRRETIARSHGLEEAIDWHERIFNALRRRDGRGARRLMTEHLRAAERGLRSDSLAPTQSGRKSRQPRRAERA